MDAQALQAALDLLSSAKPADPRPTIALYHRSPLQVRSPLVSPHRMPVHAQLAAHELFSKLREMDALGVKLIWVETPPDTPEWDGVRDRLTRAAA
jgi:L-threonylcarbamoyladenylate synthase